MNIIPVSAVKGSADLVFQEMSSGRLIVGGKVLFYGFHSTHFDKTFHRKDTKLLIGILTDDCRLKRHLTLIRIEKDAMCPECAEVDGELILSTFWHNTTG